MLSHFHGRRVCVWCDGMGWDVMWCDVHRPFLVTAIIWKQYQNKSFFFFNFVFFIYLFIYVCLCWVFVSVRGLSLVAASGGHSSSQCTGLSLSWPLLFRSTGSRRAGSVIVAHGPSRSAACGIFPDQGSNPCPLHWQADSQPLRHQGSPRTSLLILSSNLSMSVSLNTFLYLSLWYILTSLLSLFRVWFTYPKTGWTAVTLSSNYTTSSGPRTAARTSLKWEKGL